MVEKYSYRRESERERTSVKSSQHPSFSSTLLDSIYRSIDEGEDEMVICKKQSLVPPGGANVRIPDGANVRRGGFRSEEEMANFKRACMIEKWMEKKAVEKDLQVKKQRKDRGSSSWSSSDSSGGGLNSFSSSEAEGFPVRRPKPIRTGIETNNRELGQNNPNSKGEGGFSKTKLRALKIYTDLKKVKQPISPGGKLAGFLTAIFTGGKHKIDDSPSLKSTNTSTCSSASSFSRSCLSKTPSSRGKPSAVKRSVRFSPVSVIVDDESLHQNQISKKSSNDELMAHMMEKNRRVEEVARDLLRNYQTKNSIDQHLRKLNGNNQVYNHNHDHEYNYDSDASSDLFELDNLSAIGMERYREELPVYETTVANGIIF